MIKKIFIHEMTIGLLIVWRDRIILIQVHCLYVLEGYFSIPVPSLKLFVHSYGGAACGQAQYTVSLQGKKGGKDVSSLTAHGFIILHNNQIHGNFLLFLKYPMESGGCPPTFCTNPQNVKKRIIQPQVAEKDNQNYTQTTLKPLFLRHLRYRLMEERRE